MREDNVNRIEVHVAGICFNGNKVLVLKRSPSRRLFPNLWECGGGQVNSGENFEEAVIRQLREEAGIAVRPIEVVGTYEIPIMGDQRKIPGVYFACRLEGFVCGKEPKISSEHTEWQWQEINKLENLEFIPGIKENIRKAYASIAGASLK